MQAFAEHRYLELIRARHEAGGYTFESQTLGSRVINTSEPENIKAILATNFEDYSLGFRLAALGPLLGKGIFTSDSKEWETLRALIRPNLGKAQVTDLSLFERHIEELLAHIPKDGSTFDIQDLFFKLSCMFSSYIFSLFLLSSSPMVPCTVPVPLSSRPVSCKATYYTVFLQRTNDRDPVNTSTELLFGQSVHSFTAASDSPQTRFVTAFDYASGQLLRRLQLGSFLILYHDKEFKNACKTVHSFVDSIIAKAINDS